MVPPPARVSVPAWRLTVPRLLKATPAARVEKEVSPGPSLVKVPMLLKALVPPEPKLWRGPEEMEVNELLLLKVPPDMRMGPAVQVTMPLFSRTRLRSCVVPVMLSEPRGSMMVLPTAPPVVAGPAMRPPDQFSVDVNVQLPVPARGPERVTGAEKREASVTVSVPAMFRVSAEETLRTATVPLTWIVGAAATLMSASSVGPGRTSPDQLVGSDQSVPAPE